MKPLAIAATVLATLAGAACYDSPTDPGMDTVVFTATLTAASEVPAVTGTEANATGTITITMEVTRNSADVITQAEASFSGSVANMPAGSSLTLAHIHTGAAGVTGGPVVNVGLTPATAIPIVSGGATLTFNDITVEPNVAQAIIDNPAGFYFNVHSALNPGGVARGQLVRQ